MLIRPNGSDSNTIPLTQFFHEWVHKLVERGFTIADASRGKPSFPKDTDATKAIADFIKTAGDVFPYGTNSVGEKKFREQAATGFSNEYGTKFESYEMVFTPGGQFGISAAFYLVETLFPHSVIVSAQPWYLNHHDIANMFSQSGFSVIPNQEKFHEMNLLNGSVSRLNAGHIEQAISECRKQTKKIGAFLFCNPMNPLGTVTRKDEWAKIAKALETYPEALILMDEAFAEIVFDQNYEISLLHAAPHLKDRMILFRSGTKALGYPGERLAVMSVPLKYLDVITAFQSRILGNAPLTSQAGMAAAMANMNADKKKKISEYYLGNYKLLSQRLKELGINIVSEPEGGFYCLADFSKFKGREINDKAKNILQTKKDSISTDFELAVSLMTGLLGENKGVATIPASAFGVDPNKMLLRVSFSSYKEEIEKFCEFLRG